MRATYSAKIKPEVLAAVTAALVLFNYPMGQAYRITNVSKVRNSWKKAGIIENMRSREIETNIGS